MRDGMNPIRDGMNAICDGMNAICDGMNARSGCGYATPSAFRTSGPLMPVLFLTA